MTDPNTDTAFKHSNEELGRLQREVAELRALVGEDAITLARLRALASFPDENPNPVIEMTLTGETTYLNPAAEAQFPDLKTQGGDHPLMRDLPFPFMAEFGEPRFLIVREIAVGDSFYDQKVCYVDETDCNHVRIYVHDITRRKRAEEANRTLAKQLLDAHEAERQRVSRELHDEAGQALTALQLSLELIRKVLPGDAVAARSNLSDAIELAASTREQIRLLALGLRPPALDTVGLNLTLASICEDFSKRTHLPIEYKGKDVSELPDAVSICLYRTLQEALTNVAKHADASSVLVSLRCDTDSVQLFVEDDGRGIGEGELPGHSHGIGLLGMRERLELLGGALTVDRGSLGGLRLVAELPSN